MNKQRRKNIANAIDLLEQAQSIIETARDEEQEAFDNLPEGIQCSERGEAMEDAIYNLENLFDTIQEALDSISEIIEN